MNINAPDYQGILYFLTSLLLSNNEMLNQYSLESAQSFDLLGFLSRMGQMCPENAERKSDMHRNSENETQTENLKSEHDQNINTNSLNEQKNQKPPLKNLIKEGSHHYLHGRIKKNRKAHSPPDSILFKCEFAECIKVYKSKENLNLHVKNKHLGIKPYQCGFCSSRFSHRNGKTYHERKVHINYLPYACKFSNCSQTFASKSALNYHIAKTHSFADNA